ncbi:hypothetical protein JG687_00013241 [Phytophthora cactorum]|uniref:Uncharacterized protein n=1 Tax=Phytophthora cactorum TaxID=29920 RepID=A0A8T1U488_9STRA|nr:hypothetical protein JG687_00013241 [Phytophthora cactorum]
MNTSWWTTKPRSNDWLELWRRSVLLQAVRQGSQADAWNGLHQPHQPPRGEAPRLHRDVRREPANSRAVS